MSDQPGIPAITVFPPFNPAPRAAEPAPEPVRDQAPPVAEQASEPAEAAAEPHSGWDAPATPAPMPWDFEAPAPEAAPAHPEPATELGVGDEDDDLPWLEVPTPRTPEASEQEIKAEDTPNFMDWMRTEETPAESQPFGEPDDEGDDAAAPPITDFAADAQPWAPEVENAADQWQPEAPAEPWQAPDAAADEPWKAPEPTGQEPWQAPHDAPADSWEAPADEPAAGDQPWNAPAQPAADWDAPAGVDVPEPELYDLPDVPPQRPAAAPWTDAEAPLFEAPDASTEPEPAWELPADTGAGPDQRPAWESFAAETVEDAVEAEWSAPEGGVEPTPAAQPAGEPRPDIAGADVSGAFAEVADRLDAIVRALRDDPAAFVSGARGGGDPLALLVTGFVLGYQARGQNS